ncbi:metallo-mystery pair system four-Cys motif protein [Cupriavidus basilensis]|uniref:Metallo-mystery pair system four-Cys motif protein n=1 Tax=Cupriavidus basilensis TaxID=68895 RepID=A0ABT6AJA6_9BURK|nr:MbnP family copper-binding protein [Cupriavidus basilensis]MDF3832684.1 metallo-mystery pair system four-Cys motif protein [Cupriavidus basilensis]
MKYAWASGALLAAALSGCGGGIPAAPNRPVTLQFDARVGEEPFECGRSYDGIGTTASRITPSDFRLYISEVALIDAAGQAVNLTLGQDGRWQYRDVALLDFENGTGPCRNGNPGLHDRIEGHIPPGVYRGLQFTLGVPPALNHADPTLAPSPLNLTAMFWSWQAGYKFVKIDMATSGQAQGGSTPTHQRAAGFPVHLGSSECVSPSATAAPAACHRPNRVTVRFDTFDPDTQHVIIDLAALLRDTNIDINTPGSAPGCMAGPDDADCRRLMPAFGLAFQDQAAGGQRFFRPGKAR